MGRARWVVATLCAALSLALVPAHARAADPVKVLVFTKTAGAPVDSVGDGVAAIKALGQANGFTVDDTADAAKFTQANLAQYRAVVFISNRGDVLDPDQEAALQGFVRNGGGFVGLNAAASAQPGSSWFGELIGARPAPSSPTTPADAVIEVPDRVHPATKPLPLEWNRNDVWYDWASNPAGKVHEVAIARERSYKVNPTPANWNHPISWCRDYDGGRSFYIGMGTTAASYAESDFRKHLLGALEWAAGTVRGNCKATISANYKAERLTQPDKLNAAAPDDPTEQVDQIGEAHGLSIAGDGRVYYIGRADRGTSAPVADWNQPTRGWRGWGTIHVWNPADKSVKMVGVLDVFGDSPGTSEDVKREEGLVGIALDPDFLKNGYVYVQWTPFANVDFATHLAKRRISRFTVDRTTDKLDPTSEKVLLEWSYQAHRCCHMGGDMAFDADGNLYIATGDTNSSGDASGGYSGNNQAIQFDPPGAAPPYRLADARGTAGNTNDLNGKILRIKPMADPGNTPGVGSTYTVPQGNLFTGDEAGGGKTRREIYVMGVRNPARLWVDPKTGWLMTGWVGPDAENPSTTWGHEKFEEYVAVDRAQNMGWPYCQGGQPYRDRDASGNMAGWYDCANLKNTSKWNTGLVDLPPASPGTMWYSTKGGGPVYSTDADGVPIYDDAHRTITQPYLNPGGSQAAMSGPMYRYDPDNPSADKWPAFWDGLWLIGDHYSTRARRAVVLDQDTVANSKPPKAVVDVQNIVTNGTVSNLMGWRFGPDGALYVLDYGGGFFTVTKQTALWRYSYTGGPSTPYAAPKGTPTGGNSARFSSARSGGVSYEWQFGDGATSTEANPTHEYAAPGRYEATLTVTYANGETDSSKVAVDVTEAADTVAPATTVALTPAQPGPGGTYNTPVRFTLTAADNQGGSGVDTIEYKVNDGAWTTYSAPVTVSSEGSYTVSYRATDNAGNAEAAKTVTFGIQAGGSTCLLPQSDEFNGTTLDPKWQVLRDNPAARSVANGRLSMLVRNGDMIGDTATAQNVLLQDAPSKPWRATVKVGISQLTNEGEQAGLVIWQSENPNNFVKVLFINKGSGTRWFEYVTTKNNGTAALPNSGPIDGIPDDVYLRARRDGAGTIVAEYSLDNLSWHQIGDAITGYGPDLKVGLKVSDTADSSNSASFDWFHLECGDATPPATTATTEPAAPNGENGWFKTAAKVTLSATDDADGTGVDATEYQLDGGEWTRYDAPFSVAGEGVHTVRYRSSDRGNPPNVEEAKTLTVRIDSTAPETAAALDPATPGSTPVQVTLTGADAGSGVARTEYRVDGGAWTPAAAPEAIFDGTAESLAKWIQAPGGGFDLQPGGAIRQRGGLGMLWYPKQYGDFSVKLKFRDTRTDGGASNGGVFIRFPDPRIPTAMRPWTACNTGSALTSPAWVAIYCGHEIQIYDGDTGEPQKTGSVYNFQPLNLAEAGVPADRGGWSDYEIRAVGQTFTIIRDGRVLNVFDNGADRASSRAGDPPTSARRFDKGFIGLQNHSGADQLEYRDVTVQPLGTPARFTVSGAGAHTVEYRSVDNAGNVEAAKTRTFTIASTQGGPPPDTGGGGVVAPPVTEPQQPAPAAWFELGKLAKRFKAATVARRGLALKLTFSGALKGTAKLTVDRRTAKRLKLRGTTLASARISLEGDGAKTVRVKPSRKVARVLRRHGRAVKAKLTVKLAERGKRSLHVTRTVTLKR